MDAPDAMTEDRMILSRGRSAKQVIRVKSQPSNGLVIGDAGRRKIVHGLKTTERRLGRGVRILFHEAPRRQFVANLLLGPWQKIRDKLSAGIRRPSGVWASGVVFGCSPVGATRSLPVRGALSAEDGFSAASGWAGSVVFA